MIVTKDKDKRVDFQDLLKRVAKQGITHILVEGGGEIIASALNLRLVDRMIIFVSPKIIGGRDAPTAVGGKGIKRVKAATKLEDIKFRRFGSELIIEGRPA